MTGAERIAKERQRQMDVEGWSLEHDLGHHYGQLAEAAICYIAQSLNMEVRARTIGPIRDIFSDIWPWSKEWDKRGKHSRVRCLEIAGALIAAEIDRLTHEGE